MVRSVVGMFTHAFRMSLACRAARRASSSTPLVCTEAVEPNQLQPKDLGNNTNHMSTKAFRVILALAIVIGGITAVVAAIASLRWRYVHDSPLMIYTGLLVSKGAVPYRDFFDMNMPGPYFAMWAMGQIFGWNDLGSRWFDLLCLTSISVFTYRSLRRVGLLPAIAAPVLFALWYLRCGPAMSLQREYLGLVPFTAMLAVATADREGGISLPRCFASGVLAGLTILVKPQFLMLCVPPLAFIATSGRRPHAIARRVVLFGAGAALVLCAMLLYLLATGGLRPFVDMAVNYWPLYTHMTGDHAPIDGIARLLYIVRALRDGLMTFYLPMAVVGVVVMDHVQQNRRFVRLVAALLLLAMLYPAAAGQFWNYHWIPFSYFALCAASLAAAPNESRGVAMILPAAMLVYLLAFYSSTIADDLWFHHKVRDSGAPIKNGVPDEVAGFLRAHMEEGDAVQPLDWSGGAVHGMLMARAPLATRFIYDFHFYHHVNHPYIAQLRREFMAELLAARPRFIVDVHGDKPWPQGPETTRDFPALTGFIEEQYRPAQTGQTYRIMERIDPMPADH